MTDNKTIFEGLYKIDWSQAGRYSSQSPDEFPRAIRNLLSDDFIAHDDALGLLFHDNVYAYEDYLDPVIHHTFEFAMEVLALAEAPYKAQLVEAFYPLIEPMPWHFMGKYGGFSFIGEDVYKILEPYIPDFFRLLKTADADLRIACVRLLGNFIMNMETVIPGLFEHLERESDLRVQVALLESLSRMLSWKITPPQIIEVRQIILSKLWAVVQNHSSTKVRGVAAQAGVRAAHYVNNASDDLTHIPSHAGVLLIEAFWSVEFCTGPYDTFNEYRERREKQLILDTIKLLPDAQYYLSVLLQDANLSETEASFVRGAMKIMPEPAEAPPSLPMPEPPKPPILNRIGDMLLKSLQDLLQDFKDSP